MSALSLYFLEAATGFFPAIEEGLDALIEKLRKANHILSRIEGALRG